MLVGGQFLCVHGVSDLIMRGVAKGAVALLLV